MCFQAMVNHLQINLVDWKVRQETWKTHWDESPPISQQSQSANTAGNGEDGDKSGDGGEEEEPQ